MSDVYKVSWTDQAQAATATNTAVSNITNEQSQVTAAKNKVVTWEADSQQAWNQRQVQWDKSIGNIIDALQDFSKALTLAATISETTEKNNTKVMSGGG